MVEASRLASQFGAMLHIVHGYRPLSERELHERRIGLRPRDRALVDESSDATALVEAEAAKVEAAGLKVKRYVRVGDAAQALLEVADEVGGDVIVVGSRGMTGASRFLLGSVPNKVSHHANCHVLIVHTS
jgi:nucleotide-binding universal stress UspA family protein